MSYKDARALLNRGVSRPTLYSLMLPNRFGLGGGAGQDSPGITTETNDYIKLFCKSVAVPEVSVSTTNANGQEHMGITREQPVNVIYGKPLQITIIENKDFSSYRDLRSWLDKTTQNANQGFNGVATSRSQRMNYYNTFVGDIQLAKLEFPDTDARLGVNDNLYAKEYKEAFTVHFVNAYPINVGEIRMGSDLFDQATEFVVDFTYESYHINYSESSDTIRGVETGMNALRTVQAGVNVARQVTQLIRGL